MTNWVELCDVEILRYFLTVGRVDTARDALKQRIEFFDKLLRGSLTLSPDFSEANLSDKPGVEVLGHTPGRQVPQSSLQLSDGHRLGDMQSAAAWLY